MVSSAMKDSEASTANEYRETEMGRWEALLSSVWDEAMSGDVPAVGTALRIVQAECRLLGLYDNAQRTGEAGWPCWPGAGDGCDEGGRLPVGGV